ncbi:hypothetical protein FRC12_019874 [Ceratobasidium sp. 428]|nr:hypothetical protein FRC12_019874 [Ceratobasidium sp. 428]
MSKRSAPAAAPSTRSKRPKTGVSSQQTIQTFFAKSTVRVGASNGVAESKLQQSTVVIDLSLDDEEPGGGSPNLRTTKVEAEVQQTATVSTSPSNDNLSRSDPHSEKTSRLALSFAPVTTTTDPIATFPDLTTDPLSFSLTPCPWNTDSPAPYAFLAHALVTLTGTRSRITITNTLVNTLRMLIRYDARRSLLPALYMLSNCLGPSYEGAELNVGPSIIMKAIQSVSGMTLASLRTLSHKLGEYCLLASSSHN